MSASDIERFCFKLFFPNDSMISVPYSRVFYHAFPGAVIMHRGRKVSLRAYSHHICNDLSYFITACQTPSIVLIRWSLHLLLLEGLPLAPVRAAIFARLPGRLQCNIQPKL